MKIVSAGKIAAQFDAYLDATQQQPVLVTRNGKPVAILLAVESTAEAQNLARTPPRLLRSILQEGHEQLAGGEGIPHAQFWRQVERRRGAKARAQRHRGKK